MRPTALELLRQNRNFRLLFSASTITNLGDGVSLVALPWLATLLTRDAFLISLVAFAGRLPWFVVALPAGVWTDRIAQRKLIVGADLARMAVMIGAVLLAALVELGAGAGRETGLAIGALIALSFCLGSAEVLRDNAAQTFLPLIVREDQLETANGQLWTVEQVMNLFVGPPLAGVLIAVSITVPFGLDAATFAISALCIGLIASPARSPAPPAAFMGDLKEGFRWIRANPLIFRLAIVLGISNASYIAAMTMQTLYAQELLGLGSFGFGLFMTSGAGGGVVAGIVGPMIAERFGPNRTVQMSLVIFGLAYLALGLFPVIWVAVPAVFFEAAAGVLWNVVTVSYRQRIIPHDILGRVNAIYRFLGWGSLPIGALAGGLLVRLAEPLLGRAQALMLPFALAGLVSFLLLAYTRRSIRFPDR